MDFLYFKQLYEKKRDRDFPMRSFIISLYRRVLDGSYYDILPESYAARSASSVNVLEPNKYTFQTSGMSQRRPSVRSALCSIVVDQACSYLFDEGHFPRVTSDDKELEQLLNDLIDESYLQDAMMRVARDGSVGSGALLVKLINGSFYYESLLTEYCTPYFSPDNPQCLIGLCEQYKVDGESLISKGYSNVDKDETYWFRREFTEDVEIVYKPLLASTRAISTNVDWITMTYKSFQDGVNHYNQNGKKIEKPEQTDTFEIDMERSFEHNLGFVPIVWVKNLPGNIYGVQGDAIDGACTFAKAIDTNTELDYQLSQCGRGLKYSAEPILFIKDPSYGTTGTIDKAKGGVIVGDENSDAKMVEINGEGCHAVIEFSDRLREIALENIHGNRSSSKKTSFATSGKSMEKFDYPLILLASRMRTSYGDKMLKMVLRMIARMSHMQDVVIGGKIIDKNFDCEATIKLIWPQWFPASPHDLQIKTNTVIAAKESGLISEKTAVSKISDDFGINNIDEEINLIKDEQSTNPLPNLPQTKEIITA